MFLRSCLQYMFLCLLFIDLRSALRTLENLSGWRSWSKHAAGKLGKKWESKELTLQLFIESISIKGDIGKTLWLPLWFWRLFWLLVWVFMKWGFYFFNFFLPYCMSGAFPGEGNDYLLQYSCLENSMYRGAWWTTVHGVTKSWTRLNN